MLVSEIIRSADNAAIIEYPNELKSLLEEGGYVPEQMYNCDVARVCYKKVDFRLCQHEVITI